jgi:hypothetical protein
MGPATAALMEFSTLTQASLGRTGERPIYTEPELIGWLLFKYPHAEFESTSTALNGGVRNDVRLQATPGSVRARLLCQ